MAMWKGVSQGLQAAEELKLTKEQVEIRKTAEARAEKAFELEELNTRLKVSETISKRYGGARSTGTNSKGTAAAKSSPANIKNNMKVLSQRFGVSSEEVNKIYSVGGASALTKAVTLAEDINKKLGSGGYLGEDASTLVGQMLEGAIYTDPETKEYDWDVITTELGFEVDEITRDLLGSSYTIPGAVSFETPALVEKPSLTDLDDVEKRAVSNSESLARRESVAIKARLNKLSSETLTDVEELERDWLSGRLGQITSAQDSYKEKVYSPLIGLYGNSMVELVDYYGKFEGAPLNPAFLNASQMETTVPNRAVALNLLQAGILKPGMSVRNLETGKLIPLGE